MLAFSKNGSAVANMTDCAFLRVARINKGARSEDREAWELRAYWSSGLNLKLLEDSEAACREEMQRLARLLNEERKSMVVSADRVGRLCERELQKHHHCSDNNPDDMMEDPDEQ